MIDRILETITRKLLKRFKLDKILKYVEEPNELDMQVKAIQRNVNKYGKYIESIETDIAEIKAVAHKPVDWLDKINKLNDKFNKLEKKLKIFK